MARYKRRSGYRRRYRNSVPKPEIIYYAVGLLAAWRFIVSPYFMWLFVVLFVVGTVAIVLLLYSEHHKRQRLLKSGIDEVDKMSGHDFAGYLGEHFRAKGYRVTMPPKSGDYGADIVIERDGVKSVVQVKRSKSKVGIKAVQEVIGAIRHYNAFNGKVITNNYFTANAQNLADSNTIEMWNRDELIDFLAENNIELKELPKGKDENLCPMCTSLMQFKKGKYGQFWGCSSFPKCRYSRNK